VLLSLLQFLKTSTVVHTAVKEDAFERAVEAVMRNDCYMLGRGCANHVFLTHDSRSPKFRGASKFRGAGNEPVELLLFGHCLRHSGEQQKHHNHHHSDILVHFQAGFYRSLSGILLAKGHIIGEGEGCVM